MDLSQAESEFNLVQNELAVLEDFFGSYGDDIRFAESAVLFSNEDRTEFLIEWQRTPFSQHKTAEMYHSGICTVCVVICVTNVKM